SAARPLAQPRTGNAKVIGVRLYRPWTPYVYLLPACIVLGVFFFFPLARAFFYSLHEYSLLSAPVWTGLENYRRLTGDEAFRSAFFNSITYFLVVVPCLVTIPLLIAVLVNQPLRGVTVFRAIYYLPVVTSFVVAAVMWRWMYTENGVLNYVLLTVFPFVTRPIQWLTDARIALYSVMIVTIWKGLGYYMVIYLAGLQTIPAELYEAATIDGATVRRRSRSSFVLPCRSWRRRWRSWRCSPPLRR
ncbi:MAG: sugar ABC transporter permease, partial [Spirochaetales bacterium]|nr:sugar ABC transporter permease [Spirochaetales bacterium]